MSHSKESTAGLAQLGCIHVAQPWEICAGTHKELSEKVSLFFSRYVEWDGRVGKCQRTAGKTLPSVQERDSAGETGQTKYAVQKDQIIEWSICKHW